MLRKFAKFAITGGLGTVTNLALFFILADCLKFQPHAVSLLCFLVSCSQNYCLNHLWTFRAENGDKGLSIRLWLKFVLGSLAGYAINFIVLSLLIRRSDWTASVLGRSVSIKIIPQGIGIMCGMAFNFVFSVLAVFKKPPEQGAL